MTFNRQAGSREFSPDERSRVLRELLSGRYTGATNVIPVAEFAAVVGMEGRTLRAILADMDGLDCVIAYTEDGFFIAEYAEEGESWTRVLQARARTEFARAERRQAYTDAHLPRQQEVLAL